MGAGQDKTIVILLLAARLAKKESPVNIIVFNEVLRDQMLNDINRVLPSNPNISVVEISLLAAV